MSRLDIIDITLCIVPHFRDAVLQQLCIYLASVTYLNDLSTWSEHSSRLMFNHIHIPYYTSALLFDSTQIPIHITSKLSHRTPALGLRSSDARVHQVV
jgi:hypothetical protein